MYSYRPITLELFSLRKPAHRLGVCSVQVLQAPLYFYKPTFIALNLRKFKISPSVARNSKSAALTNESEKLIILKARFSTSKINGKIPGEPKKQAQNLP